MISSLNLNISIASRYGNESNGGGLRHRQIIELIQKANGRFEAGAVRTGKVRDNPVWTLFGLLLFLCSHPNVFIKMLVLVLRGMRPVELAALGLQYWSWRGYFKTGSKSRKDLLIAEDIFFGIGSFYAALDEGVPIIALPHNIDSLTIAKGSIFAKSARLKFEMSALKKANRVFSISQWDSWIHSQFGITSEILSYYPAADCHQALIDKRKKRLESSQSNDFLIAGSSHNEMTRLGMQDLIDYISDQTWPPGYCFHLVGINVEKLIRFKNPSLIKVHGFLADDEFQKLQARVKCLIVYQATGSGALTRILDSLITGIPVLANRIAAREWEGYSGLQIFNNVSELSILLEKIVILPPDPGSRNNETVKFTMAVKNFSK